MRHKVSRCFLCRQPELPGCSHYCFISRDGQAVRAVVSANEALSNGPNGINGMSLSVRAWNGLKNVGAVTVPIINSLSDSQLLAIRNFGIVSLNEVRNAIADIERQNWPVEISPDEWMGAA